MYLTRFLINPRRRDAAKLLASPQVMHAAVLAGFPPSSGVENARVLWRLDTAASTVQLIISSPEKPDLTHLVEQAGWPTLQPGWEVRDYNSLLNRLAVGQEWAFRLVANPTHALTAESGQKRGRVVAHRTVEHQLGWLAKQAEHHGFELVERMVEQLLAESGEPASISVSTARVSASQTLRFARGAQTVTLGTAAFDGLLRITDIDKFRLALKRGIGPARAYGCGLLTIAPAPARAGAPEQS